MRASLGSTQSARPAAAALLASILCPPLLSTTVPVVGCVMDDSADYKSQKQRGEENGAAFGMAGEKG